MSGWNKKFSLFCSLLHLLYLYNLSKISFSSCFELLFFNDFKLELFLNNFDVELVLLYEDESLFFNFDIFFNLGWYNLLFIEHVEFV